MTTPILGSILLGSANPGRLRDWYSTALAPLRRDDGFLSFDSFGSVGLLIDQHDDVPNPSREPHRSILNFYVRDILAVEARLIAMETIWIRELERTPWGMIGTVLDADGNYVQVIQAPPPQPR